MTVANIHTYLDLIETTSSFLLYKLMYLQQYSHIHFTNTEHDNNLNSWGIDKMT